LIDSYSMASKVINAQAAIISFALVIKAISCSLFYLKFQDVLDYHSFGFDYIAVLVFDI